MPDNELHPCRYDYVKYGEYIFNAFVKTSANIAPVMSDDGYTIKYNRVTFQCEFIITRETVQINDPIGGGVDLDLDYVRKVLTTSGQSLEISYRGLGTQIGSNLGPGINIDKTKNSASLVEGPFPELLDWEPIAGNRAVRCVWKVSYTLPRCYLSYDNQKVTNLLDRARDLLQSFTEEQELNIDESGAVVVTLQGYIEFAGLQNIHKSENVQENLYPASSRESLRRLARIFETNIPLGFHRKSKFKFLKDSRTVTYTVIDTEIESDNPLFPYMIKADVSHEVSSSLMGEKGTNSGGRFFNWLNVFNGTFQVRPGVWKGWAWVAFLVYLFNRRSRASDLIGNIEDFMKEAKDAATNKGAKDGKFRVKPKQYPIALRIKEHITSRQVDINMKYMVLCSIGQLFEATGLFFPVDTLWTKKAVTTIPEKGPLTVALQNTNFPVDIGTTPISPLVSAGNTKYAPPIPKTDQWSWFKQMSQVYQNIYGYRNLSLPNSTLIYDPCGSFNATYFTANRLTNVGGTSTNNFPEPFRPGEGYDPERYLTGGVTGLGNTGTTSQNIPNNNYNTSYYLSNIDPSNTWIDRQDSLVLIENTNASMLPSIEPVGPGHLVGVSNSNANDVAKKEHVGFAINNSSAGFDDSNYVNHKPTVYGLPSYYVRSTGYAVRVGYGIQCPALLGVYKSPSSDVTDSQNSLLVATRIGVNKWSHKQVAQTADIPVFMAMWDVTYALQGDATRDNIVYSMNSAAEYA